MKQVIPSVLWLLAAAFGLAAQEVTRLEFDDGLDGWRPSGPGWSVRDGVLVGEAAAGARATWLVWQGDLPPDFVIDCEVRCAGDADGGLVYRAEEKGPEGKAGSWRGYEFRFDVRADRFGRLYELGRRGLITRRGDRVAVQRSNVRPEVVGTVPDPPSHPERWQRVRVRARAGSILHAMGDRDVLELADAWQNAPRRGRLVWRVGPGFRIEVRNLCLLRLPDAPRPAEPDSVAAVRIWTPGNRNDQELWLRRRFELRDPVSVARLVVSCDNAATVYLNGVEVMQAEDWERPSVAEVTRHLRPGDNVIAVHARNHGGPAALGLWLTWNDPTGGGGHVVSDLQWRCLGDEVAGWLARDFDDSTWLPVASQGESPLGKTVWGMDPKQ